MGQGFDLINKISDNLGKRQFVFQHHFVLPEILFNEAASSVLAEQFYVFQVFSWGYYNANGHRFHEIFCLVFVGSLGSTFYVYYFLYFIRIFTSCLLILHL